MILHSNISNFELHILLKSGKVLYGGNKKLKIYGNLECKSGKRMKKENRVFFETEAEAIENNYRPCGHCLSKQYKNWKKSTK